MCLGGLPIVAIEICPEKVNISGSANVTFMGQTKNIGMNIRKTPVPERWLDVCARRKELYL
jgi:hypothetical protein